VLGVDTDDANNAFSFDDLAFVAHLLNRRSDFHYELLDTPAGQSPPGYDDSASASAAAVWRWLRHIAIGVRGGKREAALFSISPLPRRAGAASMKFASLIHRGGETCLL